MSDLVRTRFFALFGMGAATVCIGYFVGAQAVHWREAKAEAETGAASHGGCCAPGLEPVAPTGRPSIQSPLEFDMHLDKSEWRLGITKLRRRLAAEARGHVLEVALGTGRNLEFYDWDNVVNVDAGAGDAIAEGAGTPAEPSEKEKEEAARRRLVERLKKVDFDRSRLWEVPEREEDEIEDGLLSYTALDISPGMLDIALRRMRQVVPRLADTSGDTKADAGAGAGAGPVAGALPKKPSFCKLASKEHPGSGGSDCVSLVEGRIRVLASDAQAALPPAPASGRTGSRASKKDEDKQYYDTIVQTFGLCSVRDPVGLVANLAAAVRPGTGRIVLLEHGRSSWWEVVNGLLDRSARGHFDRFGCWWNRDIDAIVRDAAARVPGLQVVRLERPGLVTLGTHIWVELRVDPVAAAEARAANPGTGAGPPKAGTEPGKATQKKGGWFSW